MSTKFEEFDCWKAIVIYVLNQETNIITIKIDLTEPTSKSHDILWLNLF